MVQFFNYYTHTHIHIYIYIYCIYIYIYIYCIYTLPFKSLGSLRNFLIFQRKAVFFNEDNINQKYTLYIVKVVNDYSNGTLCLLIALED